VVSSKTGNFNFIVCGSLLNSSSSSSSLHGSGESLVPASSIVVYLSIFLVVYLCLVFRMVDIHMPVVECGYVPFFADVLSIYSCIVIFSLKGEMPNSFLISSQFFNHNLRLKVTCSKNARNVI
jgi:hypothetical protein